MNRSLPLLFLVLVTTPVAADWPQFMRDSQHTGDAAEESLRLPLGLAACVKLDDAVTTSPAVVGGRVYVVDQMGTAYCIDPKANRDSLEAHPDGERACGSNTSSPCVAKGRVYYGTTAGRLHILDAPAARCIKSIEVGWPITGSPTFGQRLDLLSGPRRRSSTASTWTATNAGAGTTTRTTRIPKRTSGASGFPGSWHDPHYGGGEVAVAGKRVVVNLGWDLFCLDDEGKSAKLAWCQRAPLGKDAGIPMGPAICRRVGLLRLSQHRSVGQRHPRQAGRRLLRREEGLPRLSNWAVHRHAGRPRCRRSSGRGTTRASVPTTSPRGQRLWAARTDNTLDQRQFTPASPRPR